MIAGVSSVHARARLPSTLYRPYTSFNYFLIALYTLCRTFFFFFFSSNDDRPNRFDSPGGVGGGGEIVDICGKIHTFFFFFFFLYINVCLVTNGNFGEEKSGTDSLYPFASHPQDETIDSEGIVSRGGVRYFQC